MENKQVNILKRLLQSPNKVVIIPHKSPDGDAIGSTLALHHFLVLQGHKSLIITPNNYPAFLNWMPGTKDIIHFDRETKKAKELIEKADFIFTLDFNLLSRCGDMEKPLANADAQFVMIDHHQQPDDYADFIYSDDSASSTCELIYNFIEKLDQTECITPEIATCLYVGIMTDTGSFRFPSTSSQTHRIIADLIDKGANNARIHQNVYDTKTIDQLKLLGVALNNLSVFDHLKTAYISLSQEELDKHNYKKGDTEGIVNYGLSIKGIIFAVIFIENSNEGMVKISFRSKGSFDVNDFARKHFKGGGHLNAAGGRSDKSLKETISDFERLLETYKDQLEQS